MSYKEYYTIFLFLVALCLFVLVLFKIRYRILIFNIAFLTLAVSFGVWYLKSKTKFSDFHTKIIFKESETLGWVGIKNIVDTSKRFYGEKLLFKVVYNLDENGLRRTPSIVSNKETKSVVFFGCSFTFGFGLNDNETVPYIVQDKGGNKFKVYNFGMDGYGPQQMLYVIEHNIMDTILKFEPSNFVYIAIPDHINRMLGQYDWCKTFPKYILDPNTKDIKYVGKFGKIKKPISELSQSDFELFGLMIFKSKNLLLAKYPNSKFHVILWDCKEMAGTKILKVLQKRHINTHVVSDFVSNYVKDNKSYVIYPPYENHPNYKINLLVSNYLVDSIICKK
jgi:hypothetical protein